MKFSFKHLVGVTGSILWIVLIFILSGCNSGSPNKFWSFVKVNSKTETRLTKDYLNYLGSISSADFPINSFQLNSDLSIHSEFCTRIKTNPDLSYFPTTLWQIYGLNNQKDWKQFAVNYSNVFEGIDSSKIFVTGEHIQNLLLTPYLISDRQSYYSAMMSSLNNYLEDSENQSEGYLMPISKMLETKLLFFAFNQTGDPLYKNQAMRNSEMILKQNFRNLKNEMYKPENCLLTTDSCELNNTIKIAYSDLAIGLYGFSKIYQETGIEKYQDLSRNIASLFNSILTENSKKSSELLKPDKPNLDLVTQSIVCLAFLNMDNQAGIEFRERSYSIYTDILDTIENEDRKIEDSPSFKLFYYLLEYERQKENGAIAAKS